MIEAVTGTGKGDSVVVTQQGYVDPQIDELPVSV